MVADKAHSKDFNGGRGSRHAPQPRESNCNNDSPVAGRQQVAVSEACEAAQCLNFWSKVTQLNVSVFFLDFGSQ